MDPTLVIVYVPAGVSLCIINGKIQNSMLFRKVFVGRESTVTNSIILNGTYIGEGCTIENAIIESHSNIKSGSVIIGTPEDLKVVKERGDY